MADLVSPALRAALNTERRHLRRSAMALAVVSTLQMALAQFTVPGLQLLAALALGFSLLKCRWLVLDFMGLRGVPGPWRPLLYGWLLSVNGLLLVSFLRG